MDGSDKANSYLTAGIYYTGKFFINSNNILSIHLYEMSVLLRTMNLKTHLDHE